MRDILQARHPAVLFTWAALIVVLLTPAHRVVGQGASADHTMAEIHRRVRATLLLTNNLPPGTSGAAIVRRAAPRARDYILLTDRADANQLSAALFTLMAVREQAGDTATTDATVSVNRNTAPAAWQKRETPRNARTLERLHSAPLRQINGIGAVPAYDVYLLPHVLRGRMRAGKPLANPTM